MADESPAAPRRDVYQQITDQIVETIEVGVEVGGYYMPWHSDSLPLTRPTNAFTKQRYRGVNILALWTASEAKGYTSGHWATYKQWRLLGGQVRKGEKATVVVFYKKTDSEVTDQETGEVETRTYFFAQTTWAFNADQVDGWQDPRERAPGLVEAMDNVERFVKDTKADIHHGGDRAYYRKVDDYIQIPEPDKFVGTPTSSPTESYYAVLLHELTHWTGHESRLDRDLRNRFGDDGYAMEELIAELGAAFMCADLGITNSPRDDHAAYIKSWLEALKNDKKAIFTAASKASQATDFLGSLQLDPPADVVTGAPSSAHGQAGEAADAEQ